MKYEVTYTEGAKKDLKSIFGYISEKLLAPGNATGQTQRIMAAVRKLDTMPYRYKLYKTHSHTCGTNNPRFFSPPR